MNTVSAATTRPRASSPVLVGELMSSPVITASPAQAVASAADTMVLAAVGSVVVVGDSGLPVGILTERDLVRSAAAGVDARTATVGEWMTAAPDTSSPSASIDEALELLARRGYRHLPVVDAGELVGVLSMRDLLRVASIRPAREAATDTPRGLKGVIVTDTAIGDVRGTEGFFHYRQYSAVDLARQRTLEDVWALMVDGALPQGSDREDFAAEVRAHRDLPPTLLTLASQVAIEAGGDGPLDGLRTVLSAVAAAEHFAPSLDLDAAGVRRHGLRLAAVTPTAVAALHRLGLGLDPIAPRSDLGHAANYLWMIHGTEPTVEVARAIEQYLMLTVDHGFNASTFTSRRHRLDRRRRRRCGRRCTGRALRAAPRWRSESRTGTARRDRNAGAGSGVHTRSGRARWSNHGIRPRRLPNRRPPVDAAARRGARPRRSPS